MYDIITIGGATLDIFMKDKEFEITRKGTENEKICVDFGEKIVMDDVHFTYGGGGMNTATSFAGLGLKTAFVTVIGKDEIGEGVKTALKKRNISTEFVGEIEEKSALSVALHAGERERTLLLYRGASNMITKENTSLEQAVENTKWLYITHLSGECDKTVADLAEMVEGKNVKIMWNPGSTQLEQGIDHLKPLLKHTTVLNINKEEAELLSGIQVPRDTSLDDDQIDDVSELFEALSKTGPEVVVITDGKRGASVWYGGETYTHKNHDIAETKDTTGAGDAFGSGFCAGFINTENVKEALKWGIVQGGAVITDFGAQNGLLTKERMQKELLKVDQ